MSRKSPPLALVVLLSCSVLGFLLAIQLRLRRAEAQTADAVVEQPGPFATIKTIMVGDAERQEASAPDEVTIVHDQKRSGAKTGTMLYVGDEVITGKATRLTILFLDNAAEKDNEVLVYADSRVQLGSIFTWAGKILARVKDSFSAKTTRAQWSVAGTEYELAVDEKSGTNKLVVLKGEVKVQTGEFAPTVAEDSIEEAPVEDGTTSMFLPASYRETTYLEPLPQQTPMEFVAVAGRVIKIEREFSLTNSCRRQHRYQIASPLNLNWFQFIGGEQFQIAGGQTRAMKFAIQLDGTNLPVGVQQSQIVFPCLDCDAEPGCSIGGLYLPITVNVIKRPIRRLSPSPSPEASPQLTAVGPESATVGRMQELTLVRSGPLRQAEASEAEVDEALNWSNEVIIPGAPSYPAQSVVPRYATAEERNRAFRERRRSSVVNNDQQSKEALADVYVDWGNGAKAEEELKRLGLRAPQTPQQMITLGEAYRLEGKLGGAAKLLARAAELDPNSPAAFNALGNVFLDMARSEEDRGNTEQARRYLERAETQYLKAQAVKPPLQNHSQAATADRARKATVVAQSNIGEVHLRLGTLARDEGRSDEALNQFQVASQSFSKAAKIDPAYPFAYTGVGDAHRESGETLLSRGDQSGADSYFLMSKDVYFRAAKLHGDMAEAYVGVGKVLDDMGKPDEARKYYVRATQVRPELPDPHYHLAVSLAVVDPRRAAEQAGAFLKTARAPLKQGRQASDARGIESGVGPTPRSTRTITPPPTPSPSPTDSIDPRLLVPMPHMLGDSPEKGLRKLSEVGLVGEIQDKADCKIDGKIVGTNKGRDERVPRGSRVIVYISGPGPDAVEVPNVRRKLLADAENELRNRGFQSKIYLRTQDDSVPENTVLDQRPAAGKLLPPNCTVQLTIAIPVPPVRVSRYVGLTKAQAYQQLSGDLRWGRVSEVENCQQPGIVVSQNPKEGAVVPRGSTVDLVIGKCSAIEPPPPQYVNVPFVVGKSFKQAALILENAGLVAEYSVGDPNAKVVTQEPAQGKVLKGTHVKLFPAKIL